MVGLAPLRNKQAGASGGFRSVYHKSAPQTPLTALCNTNTIVIFTPEEQGSIDVTLQIEPDTMCTACKYKWRKNVVQPKACPSCKRRNTARPIEEEQVDGKNGNGL